MTLLTWSTFSPVFLAIRNDSILVGNRRVWETRQVSITWASWPFDVLTLEWFWHFSFIIVVNCYCECSCSYRKCWMNKCDVNTLKQTAIQSLSMMSLRACHCYMWAASPLSSTFTAKEDTKEDWWPSTFTSISLLVELSHLKVLWHIVKLLFKWRNSIF